MYGSEWVSIIWLVLFVIFAIVVNRYADRKNNKNWMERMEAFIFSIIVFVTVAGAMAPQYFSMVLDIRWYSGSMINKTVFVLSMLTAWAIFAWGVEWFAWLTATSLVFGAIAWVITHMLM